jgi:hypothetical protein
MPRMPLLLSGAAKSYAPVIRTYVSLSVRTPRNKSLQKHQANLSVPARSNFSGANVQLLRSPPNPPVIYVQPSHPRAAPNPLHARTHPQYRPPVSAPVSGPMSRPHVSSPVCLVTAPRPQPRAPRRPGPPPNPTTRRDSIATTSLSLRTTLHASERTPATSVTGPRRVGPTPATAVILKTCACSRTYVSSRQRMEPTLRAGGWMDGGRRPRAPTTGGCVNQRRGCGVVVVKPLDRRRGAGSCRPLREDGRPCVSSVSAGK